MVYLKIKIALLEAGLTSKALAARLDRNHTLLSKQVNGARPWRDGDRERIARALRRDVAELFPDAKAS